MTLRNDTCRCHDATCVYRERCARWLERDTGNECSCHAETLRVDPFPCRMMILTKKEGKP